MATPTTYIAYFEKLPLIGWVQTEWSGLEILSFLCFIFCIYTLYYATYVVHKPKLYCSNKDGFRDQLITHVKELDKDVWPLVWCYRPLMQSVLHSVFGASYHASFHRERIDTRDGGSFTLDWYGFQSNVNQRNHDEFCSPIIVILPGATGHSEKNYIRQFIRLNEEMNYRTVVFNNRGLGRNVKLTTPILSCVTKGDDVEETLTTVGKRYPEAPVIVLAFSIGACIFTNYIARKGKDIPSNVIAAFVVAVPWNSMESKTNLQKFWNKLFINNHMIGQIRNVVNSNKKLFLDSEKKLNINVEHMLKSDTLWDFDDRYTCPVFGYKDHEEFYWDASADLLPLENISIPYLCINADDDPMCRRVVIPVKKITQNPNMALITTKYGGHMAWLEGFFLTRKRLHHRIFQQYTTMILNHNDGPKKLT